MVNAQDLISILKLQPHPEGGYYRETYRAAEESQAESLPQRYGGNRAFSTAIYFLLTDTTFSAMHRLASDEIFHFYAGDPVEMLLLAPDGTSQTVTLGLDLDAGERPQMMVPRMWWQGSALKPGGKFALLGCTVAPGFDFSDYEEGSYQSLQAAYPQHKDRIRRLTKK